MDQYNKTARFQWCAPEWDWEKEDISIDEELDNKE